MTDKKINYEILYPKIHVYKNLIKDPNGLVSLFKKAEEDPSSSYMYSDWRDWSVFGTYIYQINFEQPDFFIVDEKKYNIEKQYFDNINDCFYKTTNHFLDMYGKTVGDNWYKMGPSFCKYDYAKTEEQQLKKMAMRPHTDYIYLEADTPGNKFALTCTMYLNDDYEGGGVTFTIGKDTVTYKPKAGDIMVFPSGHPELLSEGKIYFHGVEQVKNKEKYFVRSFYQIPFEGSQKWHDGINKYGEELWSEMEKERIANRIPLNKVDYV
jgi:hypothetical protein